VFPEITCQYRPSDIQGGFLLTGSTALCFMATGAPLAARRVRILPMNQNAWRPKTFRMKFLPLHIYVTLFMRKNVNCGSISPSTTDYRNQLTWTWSLLTGSRSCKVWIAVVLYRQSFSSCVAVLALDFDVPVSIARRFSDFLGVCSSLATMSCNFFWVSTRR
jgi:hypothetical protein